jgi:hypothetical protein
MKKLLFSILAIIGCANYSLGQSVPSYVPKSGLVGWWPFTGNALDSSGNGNHGTVNAATLTTDRFGNVNNAYEFNGLNTYISVPSNTSLQLTNNYTLNGWFNADVFFNTSTSDRSIISKVEIGGWYGGYEVMVGGKTNDIAHVGNIGGSNFILGETGYLINVWYMFSVTYDKNTLKLYMNGELVNSKSIVGNLQTSNLPLLFGMHEGNSQYFDGKIDDIGIWNRALSACEISKLYLASNTFFTSKPANQAVKIGASASFTIKDTLGASATYQWQENAGTGFVNLSNTSPYSGVNTKTLDINPVAAGMHNNQYRCIRNGGTSCLDTSAAATLTLSNLSIKANQVEGLTIRPNPVHNSLNINAPATINKLVLYNTLGQLIFESKPGTKIASIDMSVYPAGMYILKLNDEWVEKIIKE